MLRVCVVLLVVLVTGCATTRLAPVTRGPVADAQEADYYQVRIPTHDGKKLAATIYQPALKSGESAPLIIASHGYGGFRAPRPFSIYGKTMITGRAAIAAWEAGYWVVFYDQRGFGGSQDKVNMMDLEKEVQDPSTVLDWALQHLPGIAQLDDGDPAVGMIGESYGGASQIMASFHDARLKALVPIATWHDLADGIAPNKHVRTNWGAILFTLPAITSGFSTQGLRKPLRSAIGGTLKPELEEMLRARSPRAFCENGQYPQGDALLVQGFRDTIMTMDQALNNLECFEKGERDVRLLAIQGGHILPWPVQRWSGKPLFNTDKKVHCGDLVKSPEEMILAWWDEKLRGGEPEVPEYCVTLGYKDGSVVSDFPSEGTSFTVGRNRILIPFAGLFEGFMVPSDHVGDTIKQFWQGMDLRYYDPQGGLFRPRFIPLYVVDDDEEVLLGTPEIDLTVSGSATRVSTRLFLGVGVQNRNERRVKIASEQITPLPARGRYQQDLAPVSMKLKRGDRVGLVVYGYNWQYFWNPSFWTSLAYVQGQVTLPLNPDLPAEPKPGVFSTSGSNP